jgi:hypothetical protein
VIPRSLLRGASSNCPEIKWGSTDRSPVHLDTHDI